MNVPDGLMLGAVGTLASYLAWQNRQIVTSYFRHITKQTETLEGLKTSIEQHDNLSAKAHKEQLRGMKALTKTLKSMNGNSRDGGEKK